MQFLLPTPRTVRFTSPWGERVFNGKRHHHKGIDLAAAAGTPIYAVADGIVTQVLPERSTGGYGDLVQIMHPAQSAHLPARWSVYAHLLPGRTTVRVGQQVKLGEQIAGMGTSGMSTGVHLHFELTTTQQIHGLVRNDLDPAMHIKGFALWACAGLQPSLQVQPGVVVLQRLLNARNTIGKPLKDDGVWGAKTQAALDAQAKDLATFLKSL
jgi:murein DD-endopeptidase MepM/ murein hydrolase activator NlpD